ncbi:MAG: hypothetical protein KOO62_00175 [candidate division Zixibacteria bacterium]|nr:hypothetical protein [candidate division Zixibacteria bacterium]
MRCVLIVFMVIFWVNTSGMALDLQLEHANAVHADDYSLFPAFYNGWDDEDSLVCVGESHAVHPSVLHFPNSLWGFRYWIAYTPFCISENDENPHIAVSNDGMNWEEFTSSGDTLRNPIIDASAMNCTHLSDPDLVIEGGERLWLLFRVSIEQAGFDDHSIWAIHTSNGLDWSEPIELLSDSILGMGTISAFVSPSAIIDTSGTCKMFVVEPLASGTTPLDTSRVVMYTSPTMGGPWQFVDTCDFLPSSNTMKIWHLEVISSDSMNLLALVTESPNGRLNFGDSAELFLAYSEDKGSTWDAQEEPLLSWSNDTTAWYGAYVYRSSGCWIDCGGNQLLRLFYSAHARSVSYGGSGTGWQTGHTFVTFDTSMKPIVIEMNIDGIVSSQYVINHTPLIEWSYFDPLDAKAQTQVEVAVGTDDDWEYSEMWNPAPFVASDTFLTYSGLALEDGVTYYLRLRVDNGTAWSDWYNTFFRMNSVPSIPVPLYLLEDDVVNNTPILWIANSIDDENDLLTYDFSGFHDTDCVTPNIDLLGIVEGSDSTGGQVVDPLGEGCIYWWSARAYDGYEYSNWSVSQRIYIDGTPEAPTSPQANFPPDTGGMPVFEMLTNFMWSKSYDGDPFDTVRYKLEIAVDPAFSFVNTTDSILTTEYSVEDSLTFGTHYWWRVTAWDTDGLSTVSWNTPDFWTWELGDLDHSHEVNVGDLTFLVAYLFTGGTAPYPLFITDIDGNCTVNIADLTYLVAYLFTGGPDPAIGCEPELPPE